MGTIPQSSLVVWGSGTTRTMRAHWVMAELGLDYEKHLIGSRTGETKNPAFQQLNPRGKIPVLQDGAFTIAESAAIVTYHQPLSELLKEYSQRIVARKAYQRASALNYPPEILAKGIFHS